MSILVIGFLYTQKSIQMIILTNNPIYNSLSEFVCSKLSTSMYPMEPYYFSLTGTVFIINYWQINSLMSTQ